tara:strand:- start:3206 stop:3397 length:192 start_codon:yes stop_codon:yes gene_type:complete
MIDMVEALLLVSWAIWAFYMLHVVRMKIKEKLIQIRCRLVNIEDPDVQGILESVDRIEMLLDF